MAKRKIRLTEAQLTRLIGRIVEETEAEMDMDMGMENEISKKEVVDLIADFFKQEVLPELSSAQKHKLKMKVDGASSRSLGGRHLEEGDDDEDTNISNRKGNFRDQLMMKGGGAMAAAGLIGLIGSSMGWSEFETTTKIHEFIEMAGAGNYTGPITIAMIAAGLAISFKGMSNKYNRTVR
jgi:hypothetical protein